MNEHIEYIKSISNLSSANYMDAVINTTQNTSTRIVNWQTFVPISHYTDVLSVEKFTTKQSQILSVK